MSDNHKTDAENLLNRKLDALRGCIVMMVKALPYTDDAALIVSDLDEAWKEEVEVTLKIEMKQVTAANIYSPSLGEPSDENLRIKAAELMGAKWYAYGYVRSLEFGRPAGWHEADGGESLGEGWNENIPDYPNDISGAMTLVDRLEEFGYVTIITNRASGDLKAVRVLDSEAKLLPRVALANVQDVTLARAITCAFIEVMEKKESDDPCLAYED